MFFTNRAQKPCGNNLHQANRASALTVLANAVVLRNSVQQTRAIKRLRDKGHELKRKDFQRVSPYAHERVLPFGQYIFEIRRRRNRDAFVQAHVLWRRSNNRYFLNLSGHESHHGETQTRACDTKQENCHGNASVGFTAQTPVGSCIEAIQAAIMATAAGMGFAFHSAMCP